MFEWGAKLFSVCQVEYINDLAQNCINSIANALELPQYYTKLSILAFAVRLNLFICHFFQNY